MNPDVAVVVSVAGATVESEYDQKEGHAVSNEIVICPRCGNPTGIRIAYGLPGSELIERAERGEIALGGCMIRPDSPEWRCTNDACGYKW